jgi:FkbM family methyltransferase
VSAAPRTPSKAGWLQRLASRAVLAYVRHSPIERGKYRLMNLARSFLVAKLDKGPFIRLSDLNHIEMDIIRKGLFEPETVEVFTSLLAPGMTVMDIGANIGQYALIAANRVGDRGRVHAFEPTPALATRLRQNVSINGLENIIINEAAVSDTVGEATLYLPYGDNPGENSIITPNEVSGPVPTVRVSTVTLDAYLSERGVERVDVIKIDIEGAELLALRGATGLLARDQAPVLIMEMNPKALTAGGNTSDSLLGFLGQFGYSYYPVATYYAEIGKPLTNGVVAKSVHWERFPALSRWVKRPQDPPRAAGGA